MYSKLLFLIARYTVPWRLQGTYRIWDTPLLVPLLLSLSLTLPLPLLLAFLFSSQSEGDRCE